MYRENIQKSIDYIEDNLKSEFTVEDRFELVERDMKTVCEHMNK